MEIEKGLNFIWMDLFVQFYPRFWTVGGRGGGGYINRILYEFLTISERKCVSLFFSRLSEIFFDKILKVIHPYRPKSRLRTGVDYSEPRAGMKQLIGNIVACIKFSPTVAKKREAKEQWLEGNLGLENLKF